MIGKIGRKCTGCEACASICRLNAIEMVCDEEGFYYPIVNTEKCTRCGQCEKVCPILKRSNYNQNVKKAFAGYNKDFNTRMDSTSGGIFTIIAQYVLEELAGVVAGVAFLEDFLKTEFILIDRKEELNKLRKSKYLQAKVGNIYLEIQKLLNMGVYVLFSGLPCQVEALHKFLEKDYPNLISLDMVCFGVPSPLLWKKYLQEFNTKEITGVTFKDKIEGWKNWHFKLLSEQREIIQKKQENPYMYSFLERLNVRPSCFECQFKGMVRGSDITIADCWGKGEENQRLNDNFGLSAILLQSKKAFELWDCIKFQIEYEEYLPMKLMEGNWAMFECIKENPYRSTFYKDIEQSSFEKAVEKYRKKGEEKSNDVD